MEQVGKSFYIGNKWGRYRLLGNQLFIIIIIHYVSVERMENKKNHG